MGKTFSILVLEACFLLAVIFSQSLPAGELIDPATIKSGYSEADAEIVMDIATPTGLDSVNHYMAWNTKHIIEEGSKGRIYVNVHEASSLGTDREMIEGMQNGSVDVFIGVSASYVPYAKRLGVFDLPNAFSNLAVARKVMDSGIVGILRPDFEAAGFKMFGFSDAGFRQATSNRLLQKIEDFRGFKIRTMETPNHLAYWTALGANPTPMDFSEVYISLQQGTIDGQENPYDLIVANKIFETQKYITETNHVLHNLTMIMSKVRFDSFPADLQPVVQNAIEESLKYGRVVADARIESRKKIVTDYGCQIYTMPPQLRQDILARIGKVEDNIRQNVGNDLVDRYKEIIAKAEAEVGEK
ncbi:MAG: TRAP transporter substrate-binding protein [Planctomycetota bacterium]|nr:TRAP transporter substrate-binding protein [Planctomycetota bacterium]